MAHRLHDSWFIRRSMSAVISFLCLFAADTKLHITFDHAEPLVLSQGLPCLAPAQLCTQVTRSNRVQDLEGFWLASTPFMAGDAISIADLLVVMELTQLHMLDGALKVTPCTDRHYALHDCVRHAGLNGTEGSEPVLVWRQPIVPTVGSFSYGMWKAPT